jgi:hypothetical protein
MPLPVVAVVVPSTAKKNRQRFSKMQRRRPKSIFSPYLLVGKIDFRGGAAFLKRFKATREGKDFPGDKP